MKVSYLPFLYMKNKTGITNLFAQSIYDMKTITFKGKNTLFVIKYSDNLAAWFKNKTKFMSW